MNNWPIEPHPPLVSHKIPEDSSKGTPISPQADGSKTGTLKLTPSPYRLAGAGMELAGFSVIPGLIGLSIDNLLELGNPVFTASGTLLGFCFGMYTFIRKVTSRPLPDEPKKTKP